MPLLSFDAKTKDDLTICKTIKADFFAQFCKIALDFLKGGANQKMLKGAGQKLKVKPEDVEVAVGSIARILMDGTKKALTENDLLFSIGDLGLSSECCQVCQELKWFQSQVVQNGIVMQLNILACYRPNDK